MNAKALLKYAPPAGPVLGLLLIGLVLVSALLYYRAVKIQRYLEPALALTQPRNEFTKNINAAFHKEFGEQVRGFRVKSSSILMDRSLLISGDGIMKASVREDLRKLARVFLSLMQESNTRSDISLVLIVARYPSYGARYVRAAEMAHVQRMLGFIQDELFLAEPELGTGYSTFFAGAAQPANPHDPNWDLVEFRIVPSEYLHIEVLKKLQKYAF